MCVTRGAVPLDKWYQLSDLSVGGQIPLHKVRSCLYSIFSEYTICSYPQKKDIKRQKTISETNYTEYKNNNSYNRITPGCKHRYLQKSLRYLSHNLVSALETQQPELNSTYYCRVSTKYFQQIDMVVYSGSELNNKQESEKWHISIMIDKS